MKSINNNIALFILFTCFASYTQKPVKKDLYLLFEPSMSTTRISRNQTSTIINQQYFPDSYDVYGVKSISKDGKKETLTFLFSTLNKYRYRVTDSVEINQIKAISFKNVLLLKGLHFDTSDQKNFPYAKVFVVEKVSKNEYKVIQVQSYIGSDVVQSKLIN